MTQSISIDGGSASSRGSAYRNDADDEERDVAVTSIHACLSTLLFSEKYSDMTIRCKGHEFHAHRAIVCTQSPFFGKALNHNFKEATTGIVDLPEDNPETLQRFLEFLYIGNYTDRLSPSQKTPSGVSLMSAKDVRDCLQSPPGVGLDEPLLENEPDFEAYDPSVEDEVGPEVGPEDTLMELEEDEALEDPEEANPGPRRQPSPTPEYDADLLRPSSMRDDFFTHLRLYVMADKYHVPALGLLARDRFYRAAEAKWEECDFFVDVVDELYCFTPPTDTAMREIVCRLVGNQIRRKEIRDKMRPALTKHGEFAVGVMEYMMYHEDLEWE